MFWECVGYVLGMFWKRFGDSFGQACLGVVLGMCWAYFWHVLGMDRRYFRHVLSKFGHVLGMILACSGDDSGMFPGCSRMFWGICGPLFTSLPLFIPQSNLLETLPNGYFIFLFFYIFGHFLLPDVLSLRLRTRISSWLSAA